jgi:hypothetical protein
MFQYNFRHLIPFLIIGVLRRPHRGAAPVRRFRRFPCRWRLR